MQAIALARQTMPKFRHPSLVTLLTKRFIPPAPAVRREEGWGQGARGAVLAFTRRFLGTLLALCVCSGIDPSECELVLLHNSSVIVRDRNVLKFGQEMRS